MLNTTSLNFVLSINGKVDKVYSKRKEKTTMRLPTCM